MRSARMRDGDAPARDEDSEDEEEEEDEGCTAHKPIDLESEAESVGSPGAIFSPAIASSEDERTESQKAERL